MASKPKAKAAPAPAEEPEVVAEVTIPEKSYKLSLPDSLVMLRDIDISSLSDDDRRAAILEIKALLEALEAVEKPHVDHLEQRLWLLQTWDNVIRMRLDDVRHERVLPEYSIEVTRLFDEAKLALAAAEEAARIEAEKAAEEAARAEAEAKAKAKADAEAARHTTEHGDGQPEETHTADAEPDVQEQHDDPVSAENHGSDDAHEEEAAGDQQLEDGAVAADPGDEIISEGGYEGSEPGLSLEADDDGFVKLRLLEHTEIARIRLPAHINIQIPLDHAEELVGKDAARPLRPDEEFEPKE